MALIDTLEFCHCDLNRNLNELVSAAEGAQNATVLGCGDMLPERRAEAERYARALEVWLGLSHAEIRHGDFLRIPAADEGADVIASSYAFHHLTPQEKETSIREMKRVPRSHSRWRPRFLRLIAIRVLFLGRCQECSRTSDGR